MKRVIRKLKDEVIVENHTIGNPTIEYRFRPDANGFWDDVTKHEGRWFETKQELIKYLEARFLDAKVEIKPLTL